MFATLLHTYLKIRFNTVPSCEHPKRVLKRSECHSQQVASTDHGASERILDLILYLS